MGREAPEVRLIRETLEGVLHPTAASATFFEAIERHGGGIPATPGEALALVRGPLAAALDERLGDSTSASVVQQLDTILSSLVTPRRKPRRSVSRQEMTTAVVDVSDESLPVFVLSATRDFANQLRAVLGSHVMIAVPIPDEPTLVTRLDFLAPSFVLIDAAHFPAIEPVALIDHLSRLPSHVLNAVWGTDLAYGQRVLDEALKRGVAVTPFTRDEGVAPLIDVIRSRQSQ